MKTKLELAIKSLSLLVFFVVIFAVIPSRAASTCRVGAQVLCDDNYALLRYKNVGLIANNTSTVDGIHLPDLIHADGLVGLAALFAPEHGLRGREEDGVTVKERLDEKTGVRIFSLYGKVKKPAPEMLRDLDFLLFDLQDVGARFYTFISTMGFAMQAAAEARIPFVVLDRPNPLGGEYLSGPVLNPECRSFTGAYPIPVAYGLTVGELALMIKGERMLNGLDELDLRVIRMEGWRRDARWPETGLEWTRTSPNIPDFETSLLYPGICFFEATAASVGRGTTEPFKLIGLPGIDAGRIVAELNHDDLPGVRFQALSFTPRSIPGMSSHPKYEDREIPGIRIQITDHRLYQPVETGIHLICAVYASLDREEQRHFFREKGFDALAGTDSLRKAIENGSSADGIIASWKGELDRFAAMREKYLLY